MGPFYAPNILQSLQYPGMITQNTKLDVSPINTFRSYFINEKYSYLAPNQILHMVILL